MKAAVDSECNSTRSVKRDARRLASVSAFAESGECKLSCLNPILG